LKSGMYRGVGYMKV